MIEPPTRLLRDSLKWKKLPNRRNNAMAEGINRYFMADTRAFVDANYLTTAGIFHPPEGTMAFDLHRQEGITPSVVTIEPTNTAKNDESIRGYWVPQGGSCDVPIIAADRAYVFTPDFSGCSLIVDQISDSMYRVYHVTGGNGYVEMEYRKRRDPASKLAGVMTHEFYGAPGAPRALMFMKFEEGRWSYIFGDGTEIVVLGQAIDKAVGEKRGIYRYGWAIVPMDESLAQVAIDLSGRPAFVFNVKFPTATIGEFPVELVDEFFKSVATNAKMNLHIAVPYGSNNHHISEAIFKATAKALRQAVSNDPRNPGVPSTKGSLIG